MVGDRSYRPVMAESFRWHGWAGDPARRLHGEQLLRFVDEALMPHLAGLQGSGAADDARDTLAAVFGETRNRMVSGHLLYDLVDLVDQVDKVRFTSSDDAHTMAQLYESMLREMRDAAGDSGEFYTPRPVVRFMVDRVDPQVGERALGPAVGTGGFLVEAYEHMKQRAGTTASPTRSRSSGARVSTSSGHGQDLAVVHGPGRGGGAEQRAVQRGGRGQGQGPADEGLQPAHDRPPARRRVLALYPPIGVRGSGRGMIKYPKTTGLDLSKLRFFTLGPERLVVSNIKAWEGAVTRSDADDSGLIASNRFLQYAPSARVDLGYVEQYLLSSEGLGHLGRASPGSADRNRTLGKAKFEAIRIPLPSIEDQCAIADRLDRVRAAATSLADGRLHLNAVEVVAGGREWGTPLSELLDLDVDEFEVDDDAVYRRAGVLNAGRGLFSQGELRGQDTKYPRLRTIRAGQVVLSRLKAFEGAVAVVPEAFDVHVLSQEFPTFSLRPGAVPDVVRSLLRSSRFWDQLLATSKGVGARRERVSVEAFLAIQGPSLTAAEQQRVADLHRRLVRHEELVRHRATLAAALLPAARNEVFSRLG